MSHEVVICGHLGSTQYVTDKDGGVYEHMEYFPFGETWVEEASNTERTPYLFTSKELDRETGLYYVHHRYYDPRTSVWQSPDPILAAYLPTGDKKKDSRLPGIGGVYNPRNLNLFSYTYQNPIKFVDFQGTSPNKRRAGTLKDLIIIIRGIKKQHPNLSPAKLLLKVADHFRNDKSRLRYIYTKKYGWIDLKHFFTAAIYAKKYGNLITRILRFGLELEQYLKESKSGFSPEDLPSNKAGAIFGDDVFKEGDPLDEQIENYFNSIGATDSKEEYDKLPEQGDVEGGNSTMDSKDSNSTAGTEKFDTTDLPADDSDVGE